MEYAALPSRHIPPETAADLFEALAQRVAELVSERIAPRESSAPASPWLDAAGASVYTSMTEEAVRAATKRGQLKVHRSETGRLRWHRDDLDAFLRGQEFAA